MECGGKRSATPLWIADFGLRVADCGICVVIESVPPRGSGRILDITG
jgi:hypothetical protein